MKKLLLMKITLICLIFISIATCGKKTTKTSTQKSKSEIMQTKTSPEKNVAKPSSYDWTKDSNTFRTNETEKANNKIITLKTKKDVVVSTESAKSAADKKIIALKTAIDDAIKTTNKPLTIKTEDNYLAVADPKVQTALETWLKTNNIDLDGAAIKLISRSSSTKVDLDGTQSLKYQISKAPGTSVYVNFRISSTKSVKEAADKKIIGLKDVATNAIKKLIIKDQDSDLTTNDPRVQTALTRWLATNNIDLDGATIKLVKSDGIMIDIGGSVLTYKISKAPGTSLYVNLWVVRTESAKKLADNKILALKTAIIVASTIESIIPITINGQNSDLAATDLKVQTALETWLTTNNIKLDGATIKLTSGSSGATVNLNRIALRYEISKPLGKSLYVDLWVVRSEKISAKAAFAAKAASNDIIAVRDAINTISARKIDFKNQDTDLAPTDPKVQTALIKWLVAKKIDPKGTIIKSVSNPKYNINSWYKSQTFQISKASGKSLNVVFLMARYKTPSVENKKELDKMTAARYTNFLLTRYKLNKLVSAKDNLPAMGLFDQNSIESFNTYLLKREASNDCTKIIWKAWIQLNFGSAFDKPRNLNGEISGFKACPVTVTPDTSSTTDSKVPDTENAGKVAAKKDIENLNSTILNAIAKEGGRGFSIKNQDSDLKATNSKVGAALTKWLRANDIELKEATIKLAKIAESKTITLEGTTLTFEISKAPGVSMDIHLPVTRSESVEKITIINKLDKLTVVEYTKYLIKTKKINKLASAKDNKLPTQMDNKFHQTVMQNVPAIKEDFMIKILKWEPSSDCTKLSWAIEYKLTEDGGGIIRKREGEISGFKACPVTVTPDTSSTTDSKVLDTENAGKVAANKDIENLNSTILNAIAKEGGRGLSIKNQENLIATNSKVGAALTKWLRANDIELKGATIKLAKIAESETITLEGKILAFEISKAPGRSINIFLPVVRRTENAEEAANKKIITLKTKINVVIAATNKPLTIENQDTDLLATHPKVKAALTTWLKTNNIEWDGITIKLAEDNPTSLEIDKNDTILKYQISKAPGTSLDVEFTVVRTESAVKVANNKIIALKTAIDAAKATEKIIIKNQDTDLPATDLKVRVALTKWLKTNDIERDGVAIKLTSGSYSSIINLDGLILTYELSKEPGTSVYVNFWVTRTKT